jgi:plasmid stabilization system protein ParE
VYTVELSLQAELRLNEIIDYYTANESEERTLKVLASFSESFDKIAQSPSIYKRFHSNTFPNLEIRQFTHYKTYHIYFVILETTIRIAEIFHLHQHSNKLKLDIPLALVSD